jgi:hypothetical protein
MTIYIKIMDDTGEIVAVEELIDPVYVYKQPSNGEIVRCIDTLAQGVLDAEGANIYQLYGKEPVDRAVATAMVITTAEYDELLLSLGTSEDEDEEDTDPEVPEGTDATQIMTRAELTEKVNELGEAMELLLSGVTE